MRRLVFLAVLAVLGGPAQASAGFITLKAIDSGWYDNDGRHNSANDNYLVGWSGKTIHDAVPDLIWHNFFVFDLSSVVGDVISADLRLAHGGGEGGDVDFTLYDVMTTIDDLRTGGSALTSIFDDLGSGTAYGNFQGRVGGHQPQVVTTHLNRWAIDAINAAGPDLLAIGGALALPAADSSYYSNFIFDYTGGTGPVATGDVRDLVLTTVPEPTSIILLSTALGAVAVRRWKARRT